ncbi:fatty acid--CoA ligase family protein [Mycobacterium sp. NBC_00419]|uniref:class I adenylate-forming enzyme family protein n=1 Tax=Mycobacterium sp. NBC_00419 TaxID=2975989 RepID=UPI002E24B207
MSWLATIVAAHHGSRRPAFYQNGSVLAGAQVVGKAVCAAELLADLDVPCGVGVPALLTTNADALALLLGGAAANRPLSLLGPRLAVGELAAATRASGSDVLLAEPGCRAIAAEVALAADVRAVIVPELPTSAQQLPTTPHAVAFYLHTAGTTAAPKRVPFTDQVLWSRARLLQQLMRLGPETTFATGSPLHHIGGLGNLLATLTAGGSAVATTRFSADWWRSLAELPVTHALLVPTMIEMLLSEDTRFAVGLHTLIYGASPIRPQTLARLLDCMPDIDLVNLFGQTEGSPITCLDAVDHRIALHRPELLTSVGRAVPGIQLRIESRDGSDGEVLARGSHLSVTARDGWLHTGDIGALDDDGYLRLHGRRHDMIIRGGENIYPVEVENVLAEHRSVQAAAVVGVPDPRLGETVAAFVVADVTAETLDIQQLRSWCRSRMAGFKVPQHWHVVDGLPYNAAGKLQRYKLRDAHRDIAG